MARAHHKSATSHGPDALDWLNSAYEMEKELDMRVRLIVTPAGGPAGTIVVEFWREPNGVRVGIAREVLTFPNSRLSGFWPSAFLALHRAYEHACAAAYKA